MEQTDKRKQNKLKFDRVINLARRLPQPAIHDLLRALILPIQADYLLAVGTEGQDARPDRGPLGKGKITYAKTTF